MRLPVFLSADTLARAFTRHASGETWDQIAKDIGVSRSALTNRLRSNGYEIDVKRQERGAEPEPTHDFNSTAVRMLTTPLRREI